MPDASSNLPADSSSLSLLTLDELKELQRWAEAELAEAKLSLAGVQSAIAIKMAPVLAEQFMVAGKEKGALTFKTPCGNKVKGEIAATVKWDDDKLRALASAMTWDQIKHWFTIKFSVSERLFNAIEPGPMKDAFVDARTVEYKALKVTLLDDAK